MKSFWTVEETEMLRDLYNKGFSDREITEKLNERFARPKHLTPTRINQKIGSLGIRRSKTVSLAPIKKSGT